MVLITVEWKPGLGLRRTCYPADSFMTEDGYLNIYCDGLSLITPPAFRVNLGMVDRFSVHDIIKGGMTQ